MWRSGASDGGRLVNCKGAVWTFEEGTLSCDMYMQCMQWDMHIHMCG